LAEIEASSRLYLRNGATFVTATLITRAENEKPQADAVTFILAGERLVTVRYCEPRALDIFVRQSAEAGSACPTTGEGVLIGLLEAIVDRAADHLERVGLIVTDTSRDVFEAPDKKRRERDFRQLLRRIGAEGDFTSNIRESLVSLGRVVAFLSATLEPSGTKSLQRARQTHLKTLQRDINSLTDHASFLADKISFLLEATLGMITIEQNDIIKVFSVAAGIFLPPTLIASSYGMNFRVMPELEWIYGYPFAIGLMLLSAVLPFFYFRHKGWL
jgi:magnesium transporter